MRLPDLFETRTAPLYHGCYLGAALAILASGTIEDRTTHLPRPGSVYPISVTGVSLTRSRSVAERFGTVVFQFDQTRLRQRHRIVAQDFWGQSKEPSLAGGRRQGPFAEAEEFLIGPLHDAQRYVTAIFLTQRQMDWAERYHLDSAQPLLHHPLLRITHLT